MRAVEVYATSYPEVTRKYYAEMNALGPLGEIAVNIFRAQKCSARAKAYFKRAHTRDAYERKAWSIQQLENVLMVHGASFGITFGWKADPKVLFGEESSHVFYVDLPTGQVSFHCRERGNAPDYPGEWDGNKGASTFRVIEFCDKVRSELMKKAG